MLRCTNFGLDPGRPWTRPREETSPTLIFSHWPSQAAPPGEMCAGLLSAATRVLILLALSLSHMGSHPSEHMLGVSCGWTTIPAESWQEGALRLRGAGPEGLDVKSVWLGDLQKVGGFGTSKLSIAEPGCTVHVSFQVAHRPALRTQSAARVQWRRWRGPCSCTRLDMAASTAGTQDLESGKRRCGLALAIPAPGR
jgi:hypothetical protein